MQELVELEIFFVSGDTITIPIKHIKCFDVDGIKKVINYFSEKMYESETAEEFKIEVLKKYLYNRSDFAPYEKNPDIIKNLTYIERIKDYNNMVGVTLKFNDGTERTIGINGNEDIITVEEDGNIVTIEIK